MPNKNIPLVLALDPGQTTGYALACITSDETLIAYDQLALDHQAFYLFLKGLGADYCICESLEHLYGKQTIGDFHHAELIGIAKLLYPDIYMQPASVQGKKSYWDNKKLKEMDLYIRGKEHGRSAVKHLLEWLMFKHGSKFGPHNFRLVDEYTLRNIESGRESH